MKCGWVDTGQASGGVRMKWGQGNLRIREATIDLMDNEAQNVN